MSLTLSLLALVVAQAETPNEEAGRWNRIFALVLDYRIKRQEH